MTDSIVAEKEPKPRLRRDVLVVLPGLMLAMLLAMLDNMIVATALPTIVGELGGYAQMSWVVTAYILASTISTPLYGKLGDLYGRKRLYLFAIGLFLIGSIASGAAQTMTQLIAFRGLQGLGAGGLMVGTMAIIGELVSPRERGRYQGFMASVMILATIGGPLIGGFLTDHLTWRWAFYINLPLGVIAFAVVAWTLHLPRHRNTARIDYLGIMLLSIVAAGLVLITTWGGTKYDWDSATILGLGAIVVCSFIALIIVEQRAAEPVLPLRLFRNRNFSLISIIGLLQGFAMFGALTFLPMYQQLVQKLSPTESGLMLLPMMLGAMFCSLAAGQIITRTGRYKIFPVVGGGVVVVGMLLLTQLQTDTSLVRSGLYLLTFGVGLGFLMQIVMLVAQNSVELRDIGVASSTATFVRQIGGSFGVAMFGSIFAHRLADSAGERLPDDQAANFSVEGGTGGLEPDMIAKLPIAVQNVVASGVTDAITTVFVWTVPIAAVMWLVAWFLKEEPLRSSNKLSKADDDGAEAEQLPVAV